MPVRKARPAKSRSAKAQAKAKPKPKAKRSVSKAKQKAKAAAKAPAVKRASKPQATADAEPAAFELLALPEHKGLRVDKALVQLLEPQGLTRSKLTHYFEQGRVRIDGEPAVARRRLKPGQRISVQPPQERPVELKAVRIPLDVLFEDKHLLVVNKPAGLVTHPGAGHFDDTLVNALLYHCKGAFMEGGLRPGIVHRLDKDTTGCLVVAKTEEAFTALQAMIGAREVTRIYRTLVWGDLKEDSGTIDAPMGRGADRKKMALRPQGGKAAVTHFRVLDRFTHACELECRLETGRTHQIRVHLQGIGHSVVGDLSYGRLPGHLPPSVREGLPAILQRQALHAWKLQFEHPITGKVILAEAPLPSDYRAARKLLAAG